MRTANRYKLILALLWISFSWTAWAQPFMRLTPVQPAYSTPQAFSPEDDSRAQAEIRQYLSSLKLVRVHIVAAPGHGHQIANLHAIMRLRELGYQGRIEAIYEPTVERQLKNLVEGFNPELNDQTTQTAALGRVRWLGNATSDPVVKAEKASLAIEGASDQPFEQSLFWRMNTEVILQLQPRQWWQRGVRQIVLKSGLETISLEYLSNLGIPTREDPSWREKLSAYPFLDLLVSELPKWDMLPAYSVDYPFQTGEMIKRIVQGLQAAIKAKPAAFSKPIVVPVFSEFLDESKRVSFSNGLSELGIAYLSATDPNIAGKLRQLSAGQIVFVQVGPTPSEVFEAVFARATLPALVLGKNLTSKMFDLGLPFLSVIGRTAGLELVSSIWTADTRSLVYGAFQELDDRSPTYKLPPNAITKFFIESKNTRGDLRQGFKAKMAQPESLNEDLLGQSLLELISASEKRGLYRACETSLSGE